MITTTNDIKRFFERLGLKLKVHPPKNKTSEYARHILEIMPVGKVPLERAPVLLEYYFQDSRSTRFDQVSVLLSNFKEAGHGETGICKRCGCTDGDACPDDQTGSCWWVKEDLCSACAKPEEIQEALEEMSKLIGEGKA